MKYIVPVFYFGFVTCDFGVISTKSLSRPMSKKFSPDFSEVFYRSNSVFVLLTNGILFGLKVEAGPAIWDNMNKHTDIVVSEIIQLQLQKDKYCMIPLI